MQLRVLIPDDVGDPLKLVRDCLEAANLGAETGYAKPSLEDVFVAATMQRHPEAA